MEMLLKNGSPSIVGYHQAIFHNGVWPEGYIPKPQNAAQRKRAKRWFKKKEEQLKEIFPNWLTVCTEQLKTSSSSEEFVIVSDESNSDSNIVHLSSGNTSSENLVQNM